MDQLIIAITGAAAVFLTQHPQQAWRKWACIVGLVGEPFWFYSAYRTEQWGIFFLAIIYTLVWIWGFRNNWLIGTRSSGQD